MNNVPKYLFLSSQNQRGLTLIEILVALVISLFLITGVIQLLIGTKQTYRFHDALSRIQENGRFAIDRMAADIRMADFGSPANPNPIIGADATDANGNEIDSINLIWNDVDRTIDRDGDGDFTNDIETRNYAIVASATVPACASAATSLGLNSNGGGLQELIEGVQAMQILYGVCTDTDGDGRNDTVTTPTGAPAGTFYVDATNVVVGDWPNVCSVRIHLMLVSLDDNIAAQPNTQTVFFPPDTDNVGQTFNDRCLRQAFSTTVRIRNR